MSHLPIAEHRAAVHPNAIVSESNADDGHPGVMKTMKVPTTGAAAAAFSACLHLQWQPLIRVHTKGPHSKVSVSSFISSSSVRFTSKWVLRRSTTHCTTELPTIHPHFHFHRSPSAAAEEEKRRQR
uniref:Uncharacterized protein n=1 Tax=Vitrella brassicaformis TaxID=1169539 RepID=A0A7S1PCX8_9ALVE